MYAKGSKVGNYENDICCSLLWKSVEASEFQGGFKPKK